jgi:peptide deformylase
MIDKKILHLAEYHNSILHNQTQSVKFPLSQEDQYIIQMMKYSIQPAQLKAVNAPWESAAGMAANQWGINKSIFLYCPAGDTINDLEVVINPSYEPLTTSAQDETWEGCFSVPLATGYIKRNTHVLVKYQNEDGEHIERELHGWDARVWQHENDHLNGYLYDDPRHHKFLDKRLFNNLNEVEKFYDEISKERRNK